MNARLDRFLSPVAALLLAPLFPSPAAAQTYPGIAGTGGGALPLNFFVGNASLRNTVSWAPIDGTDGALSALGYAGLRFPAGTGANYWDWKSGTYLTNYTDALQVYTSPGNEFPSPISATDNELETELNGTTTDAVAVYVMNLLTDPQDTSSDAQFVPWSTDYKPGMPNLAYQEALLSAAASDGTPLLYCELGNEYYATDDLPINAQPGYTIVYTDGASGTDGGYNYGVTAAAWIKAMNKYCADNGLTAPQFSVVGFNVRFDHGVLSTRETNWNAGVVRGLGSTTPGAVSLHVYQGANLTSTDMGADGITTDGAEDMFESPVLAYEGVYNPTDGGDLANLPNVPIWITEYNLQDASVPAWGTWAHGLFEAEMGLEWLQLLQPQISGNTKQTLQFAIPYDILGQGVFSDIFSGTDGFAVTDGFPAAPNGPNWVTQTYGQSAEADAQVELSLATAGQTQAISLNFGSSSPMTTDSQGDSPYPSLLGWLFTGGVDHQIVIENLSKSSATVNLGGLMTATDSPTYDQLSGAPGLYVSGQSTTDATDGNLTELWGFSYTNTGSSGSGPNGADSYVSLYTDRSVSTPNAVVLPAFSLTRIGFGTRAPIPLAAEETDIGSPTLSGNISYNIDEWSDKGSGNGIASDGSTDQCFYAPLTYSTDSATSITANVASETLSARGAEAGVMFRGGNGDGNKEVSVVVTGAGEIEMFCRSVDNGTTSQLGSTVMQAAPCWVKISYDGSDGGKANFAGYYATDGVTWTEISTATDAFSGDTETVGVLSASGGNTTDNTAILEGVTLTSP